jgi:membrane-associated protease RseP (regulator of RpoE activity)
MDPCFSGSTERRIDMRQASFAIALLGLAAQIGLAQGNAKPARKQKQAAPTRPELKHAYLGLGIEPIPSSLSSQLPGTFPKGQGVLVARVAKDSPAAKAGLQAYDILLSFGDQQIHSPEQLIKLVRGDKPGQTVAVGYVRGGKPGHCKVTLGEHESADMQESSRVFRLRPDERLREMFEEYEAGQKDGHAWKSFDALKLTRLDDHHWRAEIDYRTNEGKKEHKNFEGTREELRKDIRADKDLPAEERSHLLRALNLHEPVFEFHFPPFDRMGPGFWDQP